MLDQWKQKIRYAHEPNNPGLLSLWLSFEESQCQDFKHEEQWQHYLNMVRFLLDTYSDTMNPDHWRSTCLDHISRPLCGLQRLAKTDHQQKQLKELMLEIKILSHYFAPYFIKEKL